VNSLISATRGSEDEVVEATVTSEMAIEGEAEYDEKRWEVRVLELFRGGDRSLAI